MWKSVHMLWKCTYMYICCEKSLQQVYIYVHYVHCCEKKTTSDVHCCTSCTFVVKKIHLRCTKVYIMYIYVNFFSQQVYIMYICCTSDVKCCEFWKMDVHRNLMWIDVQQCTYFHITSRMLYITLKIDVHFSDVMWKKYITSKMMYNIFFTDVHFSDVMYFFSHHIKNVVHHVYIDVQRRYNYGK